MEHYYFIEKKGKKIGPYKLNEMQNQSIYFDELVWRSDSDIWKKANEFSELEGILIINPPPLPKEVKIKEIKNNFFGQFIGKIVVIYILTSLFIGIFSTQIAQSSWDEYKSKHPKQSIEIGSNDQNNIISFDDVNSNSELSELEKKVLVAGRQDGKKISGSIDRSLAEVSSDRYDSFVPGNYDNEDAYALGQSFWFRSFKAFFGTVYLTKKEQNEPNELQINLISSTFASLFLIFLFIIAVIFSYRINQE